MITIIIIVIGSMQ